MGVLYLNQEDYNLYLVLFLQIKVEQVTLPKSKRQTIVLPSFDELYKQLSYNPQLIPK
ncbi:hypothetical protein TTHERM_00736510 (macronuclear) [Tetrahymena thermophila SB210]|uniref:Uncharacterized protein n=1 Tax=Tetrahymena thermophila (strain SB210) TaxID=312017 RepID=Q231U4_TETTS|nr:hypothetical protein TTHERM_00736510 [Tetrahymena thermophila SB210]EAR91356.1 hypothetical protein TTHERM_00736510 [Tetrahymena thermophila SB210]|eukprot:XP_001011601.1 hypothetical protein TTHERM_00736510 [Tetrahymena thermophila SB210]